MKWFDIYSSNTMAGSGNHHYFGTENGCAWTGRIYYKAFAGGTYRYSLLFSNIMDSSYRDGSVSHGNLICDEWEILEAAIGVCREVSPEKVGEVPQFSPLTFGGNGTKHVMPGEFFASDPVELTVCKNEFICFQVKYKGEMIPYHLESLLPVFVERDGEWIPDKRVPFPGMIGCDRSVKARIGFLGDSITQGIGTPANAYSHWSALVSEAMGEAYSYWNLGLGQARAQDAASDSAWLYKAKQMDGVVLTLGTNDVSKGRTEEQIKRDLKRIVDKLKAAGVKIFVQTIPPFDWTGQNLEKWKRVNAYILAELAKDTEGCFDAASLLADVTRGPGMAKYGTHPDEKGCRVWAEALIPMLKDFLKTLK